MISYFNNPNEGNPQSLFLTIMLLAAGREVASKTSAYNITKLSYRLEVRVFNTWISYMHVISTPPPCTQVPSIAGLDCPVIRHDNLIASCANGLNRISASLSGT